MSRRSQVAQLSPIAPEHVVSLQEVVTRAIRDGILNEQLEPGERLRQEELAAQLGVSRQPVREALRRLQADGLIQATPDRGFTVRKYTEQDVRENYALRVVLEAEGARQAARRITDAELAALKSINAAMEDCVKEMRLGELTDLNAEWHGRIIKAAGMPTLRRFTESLWVGRTVYTPLFVEGRAARSVNEHRAIVGALTEHNGQAAQHAMSSHISNAAQDYFHDRGLNVSKKANRKDILGSVDGVTDDR